MKAVTSTVNSEYLTVNGFSRSRHAFFRRGTVLALPSTGKGRRKVRCVRCDSGSEASVASSQPEPDLLQAYLELKTKQNTAVSKKSSWNAAQAGDGNKEHDYLYELGRQAANMRTEVGQNKTMLDPLFAGGFLGVDSDIASGELRKHEFRTLSHHKGDYHIPEAFLTKFCVHITKNFLNDGGYITDNVPLILGIWGHKGCGKSFNAELACKAMGIHPIIMSAGELEDMWAGTPGKLIRERYRRAAEVVKNHGKMCCLIINDLDAGCGRFKETQVTVNNQMVMGTLMNICDHPQQVSVGKEWREDNFIRRVPIIITANDLSTLYAPLLRDGRMEKFYWEPSRHDLLNMVFRIFQEDGFSREQIADLLSQYPDQPLDFFGALRARMYDSSILKWVAEINEVEGRLERV